MQLARASLKTISGDQSVKKLQRLQETIANKFRKEYDEIQKELNQVRITEGGAHCQIYKDKIFLCNDDRPEEKFEMGVPTSTFQPEQSNTWREKVLLERDLVVQKIEEKLNSEVKTKNKELKRL